MAVAICAVVTVAATGDKDTEFDTVVADKVIAKRVFVKNDAGLPVVYLGSSIDSTGLVHTYGTKGNRLVKLGSIGDNEGMVATYQSNGKALVRLWTNGNGGEVDVLNKTGERSVTMNADEYGNGLGGAWNRKGKGRTLKPGP